MRYLLLLQSLGASWQGAMRERGVSESTIESWTIYYSQLCTRAATCKAEEVREVGHKISGCFKTAMWYMEKGQGT